MESTSKTTFFQGAGDKMGWSYTKTQNTRFVFSSRSPPVPADLPSDSYVVGITYYEKDKETKKVTDKIADTQYSVTGSMSTLEEDTPAKTALRELREELGVDCDDPRVFHKKYVDKVDWQTYTTFLIPATSLRPLTEKEASLPKFHGEDNKRQKVQIFVYGSYSEVETLLKSVDFRMKTATETDIAGATIIPTEMIRARYRDSFDQQNLKRKSEPYVAPCRNYNSPSGCRFGDRCRFAHVRAKSGY